MSNENINLIKITDNISYLPASEVPLSADVVFIELNGKTYIFDVGADDKSAELINNITGEKIAVISHFHQDHASNVDKVNVNRLYASKETIKHINVGETVSEPITLDDDTSITAMPITSSHSKGCIVLICGEYAFLGDCAYAGFKHNERLYNVYQLGQLIKSLKDLDVKYFGMSHYKNFIYEKQTVIAMLEEQYKQRAPGCDFIKAITRKES